MGSREVLFGLKKTHPDYFRDHEQYSARITAVNNVKASAGVQQPAPMGAGTLEDLLAMIAGGGQVKPLPKQFDDIDPARIKQFLPRNYDYGPQPKILPDQDAAFGYAATVLLATFALLLVPGLLWLASQRRAGLFR